MDVAALHRSGREAWPDVEVTADDFAAYLATRSAAPERAVELYLACACARGDATAIRRFDDIYLPAVRTALARSAPDRALADEALQVLRHRLFVADGKPRGIAGYAGHGALAGWLRVAATRVVLTLARARRPTADEDELAQLPAPAADPALALLRERHAGAVNDAIRTAFAELEPRERTLLRQRFVDDLGIDGLARVHAVHRATAARWINRALATMEARARALLMVRLDLSAASADSLIAMLRSDLHLSLAGA